MRRSNALQDWAYGRELRYSEVMGSGRGPLGAVGAAGMMAGMVAFLGAMALPPTRALLDRVLPAPGTGPRERCEQGLVPRCRRRGDRERPPLPRDVAGQGDPGYAATAVMLGESALALALDTDRLPARAGS